MSLISRWATGWRSVLSSLVALLTFLTGLGIVFVAVLWRLEGIDLYVSISIGSLLILGALIFSTTSLLIRNFRDVSDQKIKNLEEEKRQLTANNNHLNQRVHDLEQRKIQVLDWRLIADISVIELDANIRRPFDRYFDKNKRPLAISTSDTNELPLPPKEARFRFVGTLETSCKVKYGVRLQDLHIKMDTNNRTIYISGVKASFTGIDKFPYQKWHGSVVMQEGSAFKGSFGHDHDNWKVDPESRQYEGEFKDRFKEELRRDLDTGPDELRFLESAIQQRAQNLIQRLLGKAGYRVVFIEKATGDFTPLLEYINSPKRLPDE